MNKKVVLLFSIFLFMTTKNMENMFIILDTDGIQIVPYIDQDGQVKYPDLNTISMEKKKCDTQKLFMLAKQAYEYKDESENLGENTDNDLLDDIQLTLDNTDNDLIDDIQLTLDNSELKDLVKKEGNNLIIAKNHNNIRRGRAQRFKKLIAMEEFNNEQNNKPYLINFIIELFQNMFPGNKLLSVDEGLFDQILKKDPQVTKAVIKNELLWNIKCPEP